MNTQELVEKEIFDFHENIENWFTKNTTDKEALLSSLLQNFHPDFKMKGSRGNELDYEGFASWLPSAFGRFSTMEIKVSDIKIQLSDKHALAEYVETQNADGEMNTRKASAVFFIESDHKIRWYHLLEEWI
ncbi:hypothetical protein [Chryseobacterium polytrichastri]|uniref:DUF4440 domain-containing protein n=1 Tax=Chryseobacterium polytrichastri TaxID=1302687 RepID=A0A1M6RSD4_9FLAO|nr:hypothetical protein [Chryseobacterium polytrichastri]SHK35411.1 hypothetical protein SAMN05444267_100369 [Chryseobacterium polytrichastri]